MLFPKSKVNQCGVSEVILEREWVEKEFEYAKSRYLHHYHSPIMREGHAYEIRILSELLNLKWYKVLSELNQEAKRVQNEKELASS